MRHESLPAGPRDEFASPRTPMGGERRLPAPTDRAPEAGPSAETRPSLDAAPGVRPEVVLVLDPTAARLDSADHPDAPLRVLRHGRQRLLQALGEPAHRALRALVDAGVAERRAESDLLGRGGVEALARWYYGLDLLCQIGALRYVLRYGTRTLATVPACSRRLAPVAQSGGAGERWRLSRFACVRRENDELCVESPLTPVRIMVPDRAVAAVVGALGMPSAVFEVEAELGVAAPIVEALVTLLRRVGLLTACDAQGAGTEDGSAALGQWDYWDLAFHASSRLGGHDRPVGATFDHLGQIPPLPAVKAPMTPHGRDLERPDLQALLARDAPLTAALEQRRSIRSRASHALTRRELGEFLFRVGRVRRLEPAGEDCPYETSSRVYPSGGACYPLELYPVIGECLGLEGGTYHYDPWQHRLHRLPVRERDTRRLLADACLDDGAGAGGHAPPVVIIIAARFQRVGWKYRSIAYATVLKEVGAMLQTMYLVATAMRLAPCAIGSGDSALFARAIGTDPHEESSVGELALGRAPAEPPKLPKPGIGS